VSRKITGDEIKGLVAGAVSGLLVGALLTSIVWVVVWDGTIRDYYDCKADGGTPIHCMDKYLLPD
jgi:hypothetical protein